MVTRLLPGVCQSETNCLRTVVGRVPFWTFGGRGLPLRCVWLAGFVDVSGISHWSKWRVPKQFAWISTFFIRFLFFKFQKGVILKSRWFCGRLEGQRTVATMALQVGFGSTPFKSWIVNASFTHQWVIRLLERRAEPDRTVLRGLRGLLNLQHVLARPVSGLRFQFFSVLLDSFRPSGMTLTNHLNLDS